MNNKERAIAVLNYQDYDRLPIVHFGFWRETLYKWADEGHITIDEAQNCADCTPVDKTIGDKLGFDFNWEHCFFLDCRLRPEFDRKIIRELPDGSRHMLDRSGAIVLEKGGAGSIPAEIDHTLIDAEIERLKPLVELGGYIPCPDHRIAPDAKWENVQYYCKKMHELF